MRATLVLLAVILAGACRTGWYGEERDFRGDMRSFVGALGTYARTRDANFIVIPQNGHELLTENGEPTGVAASAYVDGIDGVGREDLLYGYDADGQPTPEAPRDRMIAFMDVAEGNGLQVLATDYTSSPAAMDDSYAKNQARGYISFAAPHWAGNSKVEYWDPAWQAVIFGSAEAYLDRILAAGFDGVYLDIIDAYEYFEDALSS